MRTIVISDIHLGIDPGIAENIKNRPLLIDFLDKACLEGVDEIVINGDFLDQWFLPGVYEHEPDSDAFYRQCAAANREVMDAFTDTIKRGVDVVYVPGNHDMTLSHQVLAELIPGIRQARDVRGLGKYRTGHRGEVVIEHGHRYESFCAPDMLSNKKYVTYGEPILPPGYFFARVGVQGFAEGQPDVHKKLELAALPDKADKDQIQAYAYQKVWKTVIEDRFPVKEGMEDKFIKVNVDGFEGAFSLSDIYPVGTDEGITARLYGHFQRNWDELQRRNLVPAPIDLTEQLSRMTEQSLRAEYARREYIDLDPTVDVVVFGHTHVPYYQEFEGYDRKKIYVNEGTWIDHNMDDPDNTAVFADITSDASDTKVELKKCIGDGKVEDIVAVKNQYV